MALSSREQWARDGRRCKTVLHRTPVEPVWGGWQRLRSRHVHRQLRKSASLVVPVSCQLCGSNCCVVQIVVPIIPLPSRMLRSLDHLQVGTRTSKRTPQTSSQTNKPKRRQESGYSTGEGIVCRGTHNNSCVSEVMRPRELDEVFSNGYLHWMRKRA
jgi:hypothetical protein